MRSVLLSIRPKWCELIASGKKTIEVRKTKPKLETPFKVYIYCSDSGKDVFYRSIYSFDDILYTAKHKEECKKKLSDNGHCIYNGKVIGEFTCRNINEYRPIQAHSGAIYWLDDKDFERTGFEYLDDMCEYGNGANLYGWEISDLVIYDQPKDLSEFMGLRKTKFGYETIKITRPPQSWCYVERSNR